MATATLELINPYSKYGLKRRSTYDEIIGLIGENDTITGNLPNRDATFFKASPEGSFFDGLDHLELLKEQQNRIHERQLRELLLRQNLGNNTYNVARLQQQRREGVSTNVEVPRDENLHEASIQTELEQRARRTREREQQTGEGHKSGFLSGAVTPIIDRIFSIATPKTPTTPVPTLKMPKPLKPVPPFPETIHIGSDVEEISSGEMMTARDEIKTEAEHSQTEPKQAVLRTITYRTNIATLSAEALKFQLFLRGVDADDPETQPEGMRRKGKGGGKTQKSYYLELAQQLLDDGRWETRVEEQLLKKRIKDYRNKNQPRGSRD